MDDPSFSAVLILKRCSFHTKEEWLDVPVCCLCRACHFWQENGIPCFVFCGAVIWWAQLTACGIGSCCEMYFFLALAYMTNITSYLGLET